MATNKKNDNDFMHGLGANERAILATLLGSEFLAELSSAQWGSEELHSAIHARLQERLGSGELGELLARLQLGQMESSLFSMFSKLGAETVSASGNLSSAGLAEQLAAGLSSWLSSWSAGSTASTSLRTTKRIRLRTLKSRS